MIHPKVNIIYLLNYYTQLIINILERVLFGSSSQKKSLLYEHIYVKGNLAPQFMCLALLAGLQIPVYSGQEI